MNIAWFSEMPMDAKFPRTHENMRTEFAWFVAQQATHHNILSLQKIPDNTYDLGVIIIPKDIDRYFNFDVVNNLRRVCKKYAFMQEGPSWYFQDLPIDKSFWFYNIMVNADFVLAHNDVDRSYYEGLLDKKCYINPTLMIEDPIVDLPDIERKNVIIGGNLVRWYGGFNSFIVAQECNEEIYAPQMGRMEKLELEIEGLNHIPYVMWDKWIYELNKFKYAVHLNPNSIGGTFSLNCAYLGIPCIGNVNSNTQKYCYPDLSVLPDDLSKAKQLMSDLCNDKDFYLHCSNTAKELYQEYFSEKVYLRIWDSIIKEEFNEN
tara:strand:+ start:303 stop:1256 length:954 start_codon:yes stop_codon:yes gene_type:complete